MSSGVTVTFITLIKPEFSQAFVDNDLEHARVD